MNSPDDLPGHGWLPAKVPGTAAEIINEHRGRLVYDEANLDGRDWWWRTTVANASPNANWLLTVDGLATIADVWISGTHVLSSENMFRSYATTLATLPQSVTVVIRCRATHPFIAARYPRPRWKSSLVTLQGWRWLRTTLLGRVPAWAGSTAPVGPWRPLSLRAIDRPYVVGHCLSTELDGEDGIFTAEVRFVAPKPPRHASIKAGKTIIEAELDDHGVLRAKGRLSQVQHWWPHTHGEPHCYGVSVVIDEHTIPLPKIGFRTVVADRSTGGFDLRINGVPVFIRGACWMPLDPVSLNTDLDQLRVAIELTRKAGFNMIRVVGGTVYETDAFYDACTEAGILVWQDFMLATLDPPDDAQFIHQLEAEATQFADRVSGRPCIATVNGGSEIEQQPSFLGIPPEQSTAKVLHDVFPRLLQQHLPDVPYVPSTPTGGVMPTDTSSGISHYYGLGAYLRPLSDVRTSKVRFAAECLALSIPPEAFRVQQWFGSARAAGHHPDWKTGVPRDRTASWDFEDIRDYYIREVFHIDPMLTRMEDPERYLDLGRAIACVLMCQAFTQWRRPTSLCSGALVWTFRDLMPGAGWGITDCTGEPKAPWYALQRVLSPIAVLVSDDGLDGIVFIVCNDTAMPLEARLEVQVWSAAGKLLERATKKLEVPARAGVEIRLDEVIGHFTDAGYAYRFGPRVRDGLQVTLIGVNGSILATEVTLFGEHIRPVRDGVLTAILRHLCDEWYVDVASTELAQWVAITCADYRPAASWFHLPPGSTRRVRLERIRPESSRPTVFARALNAPEIQAEYHSSAFESELEDQ
ncbi:glycosyl hydrolase 2 galactose-binding domain-containing protein [Lentzea aerocolonigenes]|uniref:glycosyl hydrolase 2 galactose-binding domain-containing protein n=1 Tax=Lentzea aerocolonigenes TaxID=68170 RepID=UPI003F702A6B